MSYLKREYKLLNLLSLLCAITLIIITITIYNFVTTNKQLNNNLNSYLSHPLERPRLTNLLLDGHFLIQQKEGAHSLGSNVGGGDGAGRGTVGGQNKIVNSQNTINSQKIIPEKYNEFMIKNRLIREKIERLTSNKISGNRDAVRESQSKIDENQVIKNTKNIHIFYSTTIKWYKKHNTTLYQLQNNTNNNTLSIAETSINIVFYPMLGFYEINEKIIRQHFRTIKSLGIDVIIITWKPVQFDHSMEMIRMWLDTAEQMRLQITFELDDYPGRTADSVKLDLLNMYPEIWYHPGFYKIYVVHKQRYLSLFYIKDFTKISAHEWKRLFKRNGQISIRNTIYDAIFIGHISSRNDPSLIRSSGLDGFYSRLVSNGATYASTWKNWSTLKKIADKYNLLFVPTVGPGYNVRKKQPKAGGWRRHRSNGQYFGVAWRTAISANTQFIQISSYNDWTSGNQIEQAIQHPKYHDYHPGGPTKYLDLCRNWVQQFISIKDTHSKNCYELFNNTIC